VKFEEREFSKFTLRMDSFEECNELSEYGELAILAH